MSNLSVTRSLTAETNPSESQFDTMRTDLLDFFNAQNLDENNLGSGGLNYTDLTDPGDDEKLEFTDSDAYLIYNSGANDFHLNNTQGDLVFKTKPASTLTEYMRLRDSDGALALRELLKLNTSVGDQTVDLTWILSRYKKPLLEYTSDDVITIEENSTASNETLLLLRDRLTTVIDRTMSLAVTANGYDAGHTGAAVSGLEDGLTRSSNTWYYIYGVEVQYGDDNDGTNSIIVASETSPEQSNVSTLNTEYGSGKWVYLGVIRNGWNDGSSDNIIVPFIMDEHGSTRFKTSGTDNEPGGIVLAEATSSSADLEYTLAFGNGAAQIPPVATRGTFGGRRDKHGFAMDYESTGTGEHQARETTTEHDTDSSRDASLFMTVPLVSGYKVEVQVGSDPTNQIITLHGLVDHYA